MLARQSGVTGFVVDSVDEAVEAVGRVNSLDRSVCRQMFEAQFDAGRMARDYVAVYRQLLARQTGLHSLESSRRTARELA